MQVELRVALRRAACTDTDIERAADAKRADWVYLARTERCHGEASEPCGPADERHKGCHRSALRRRQSRGRKGATGDRTTAHCDALSCSCDGPFIFGEDRGWARVLFRSGSVKKKMAGQEKEAAKKWCVVRTSLKVEVLRSSPPPTRRPTCTADRTRRASIPAVGAWSEPNAPNGPPPQGVRGRRYINVVQTVLDL